ncbi:hypothetical protein OIU79_030653 [Salix purpurea]|uniref:Uncharacterized protein n=1 Tax=Salix purpurea TaxID=77065 RepID=A0A9Q0VB35_SALPP|nr:hypothetical protein OIU79_030653 [Salix purpurea]
MEGVPPSSMEDDFDFTSNQFGFQASEDNFNMFEFPSSPPEEVPVNQSSILCNDQAGQNRLVDNNDSIQQATQFPHTMMEGAPPSSVEDDVNFALNQLELETLLSGPPWLPLEEVPVNQSSMLQNPGPDSSLQSQNIQQVRSLTELSPIANCLL